jgi:glycosyltransferase involved in cell wall biosynthesis
MTERPRVLFLDVKPLRPRHDAASLRSCQVIEYLTETADVAFGALSDTGLADAARSVGGSELRFLGAGDPAAIRAHIAAEGASYRLVVLSWGVTAAAFLADARRAAPRAAIVYDTQDVNHVSAFRQARATGDARYVGKALHLRQIERAAMAAADRTIAITDADRVVLEALVPSARVAVAGIWIDPDPQPRRPTGPTILFVGHYQAAPNRNAAILLAREILPRVRARVAGARLVLAGSDPNDELLALRSDCVEVPGWQADLRERFRAAAVFAAPLRFGSGLKGKVLQALTHRVPLVASAVATEGVGLRPGRDYLDAETPEAFAEAIQRILADPAGGARLAEAGAAVAARRFSRAAVRAQFAAIFAPLLAASG